MNDWNLLLVAAAVLLVTYLLAYCLVRLWLGLMRRGVRLRQEELIDTACDTEGYRQLRAFSTRLSAELTAPKRLRDV
jgi:hypothetical protein